VAAGGSQLEGPVGDIQAGVGSQVVVEPGGEEGNPDIEVVVDTTD